MPSPEVQPVARLREVSLRYDKTRALDAVSIDFPAGCMVGVIGPDGVGKSSMLALVAGARAIQSGKVEVLGGDMADEEHRRQTCPRVAYMPQGLGKNLYPSLSVFENIDFFARLFGQGRAERHRRIAELLKATGLDPFQNRAVGKLSGGMKQKLGLCCALIHDPDLLILDEPTTGVDPLSRRQFWELIETIRARRPGMSMLVATAYMEEAARFDWLVAMNAGRILATGSPRELLELTGRKTLEETFIALLPQEQREGYRPLSIPAREGSGEREVAIEARDLTKRFGDFVAVDHVSFQIFRGEIFGFLGSNGCGKTTTMKMLTGLLPATEGEAWLFGHPVDAKDIETRRRVGYMTQGFSLYGQLTVRENLVLHARLFSMPEGRISARVQEMAERFGLVDVMGALPDALPLGQRQRLSLAVAMVHNPELLILDEPTSGVDPVAREAFWQIMVNLARLEKVTIFISTHFMNEAERCDRISLMHAGRVLVSDTPEALVKARGTTNLEDAFIRYLQDATEESAPEPPSAAVKEVAATTPTETERPVPPAQTRIASFDLRRLLSYARREALELSRDPVRLTLAMLGSVILMFVMGYGISLDVDELNFAVLDRDQTTTSRDYVLDLVGSRYFIERPPIRDYADMDRRMRSGEISLALEIPPDFGRKLARGDPVQIGAWFDGAMPTRGETIRSYAEGAHVHWLNQQARETLGTGAAVPPAAIETRFRYNPNVESLIAMVPGVIPLLLMLIPAILTALAVVREKELGSIINFYVTPVTRIEFLLGKQLPYILLAMLSFLLLTAQAVLVLRVPLKGSFLALSTGALVYVIVATAFGLVISSFMRSQIAALFGTAVLTLLPVIQFSGMIEPVPSLEGLGAFIGPIYPTSHFLTISRGTFAKALGFADLGPSFIPLLIAAPVLIGLSVVLLKKQAR